MVHEFYLVKMRILCRDSSLMVHPQDATWRTPATTWVCAPRGTPWPRLFLRDTRASGPLQSQGNAPPETIIDPYKVSRPP